MTLSPHVIFWPCQPVTTRLDFLDYLVWLVAEARLEWFSLEDHDYRPQLPDAQGELHSRVFPGLRLPVAPLWPATPPKSWRH